MPAARTPSEKMVDRSEGVSPPSRSWVRTSGGNGRPRKNCFRRNSTLPYRGEGACERPLIVTGFGKAETERLDRATVPQLGGDRGNRTGIDPATQEQPERHITDELVADRTLQLLPERLRPLGLVYRLVRGEC